MKLAVMAFGLLMTSQAALAQVCESNQVSFVPDAESVDACAALNLTGEASLMTCDHVTYDLKMASGLQLQLSRVEPVLKSQNLEVDDETKQVTFTNVSINPYSGLYQAIQSTTDRRGHILSQINCVGTAAGH